MGINEQSETGETNTPQTHHYYAPDGLRNGREAGAWAYGVACGISAPVEDPTDARRTNWTLHATIKTEYVDGAVTAIVAAGGAVRRVLPGEYSFPVGVDETILVVKLGE